MANMSYCKFQNTLEDLHDCSDSLGSKTLSAAEFCARADVIEVCREILAEAEGHDFLEEQHEHEQQVMAEQDKYAALSDKQEKLTSELEEKEDRLDDSMQKDDYDTVMGKIIDLKKELQKIDLEMGRVEDSIDNLKEED